MGTFSQLGYLKKRQTADTVRLYIRSRFAAITLSFDEVLLLARVHSGTLIGIDAHPVEAEVDVYPGLPSIAVVGLPDNAVKESTARVKGVRRPPCRLKMPRPQHNSALRLYGKIIQ